MFVQKGLIGSGASIDASRFCRHLLSLPTFVVLLCLSCARVTTLPGYTTFYEIDFTPYTNKGFLITPERYDGRYESIGLIEVTVHPARRYFHAHAGSDERKLQSGEVRVGEDWAVALVDLAKGLELLHAKADSMGADAIMRFSVETATPLGGPANVSLKLGGYAIKRE